MHSGTFSMFYVKLKEIKTFRGLPRSFDLYWTETLNYDLYWSTTNDKRPLQGQGSKEITEIILRHMETQWADICSLPEFCS